MSDMTTRKSAGPKRFYSPQEAARFGVDGTDWLKMFAVSLTNIKRGNFNEPMLQDARRMGELSGLTNRRIGRAIAFALASRK